MGRSTMPHLGGPDLAKALLARRCPEALPHFKIVVGFDPALHGNRPEEAGKTHHVHQIAKFYGVPYREIAVFDISEAVLTNGEGWLGVLVRDPKEGFRFEDVPKSPSPPEKLFEYVSKLLQKP